MSITETQAQTLCSPAEWKTVVNSFPPKLSELGPSKAKKNANRIARFLDKAEDEGDQDRATVLREALERVRALASEKVGDDKRRQKEKMARAKSQAQRNHRAQLRETLRQKTETNEASDSTPEQKPKKKSIREQMLGEMK